MLSASDDKATGRRKSQSGRARQTKVLSSCSTHSRTCKLLSVSPGVAANTDLQVTQWQLFQGWEAKQHRWRRIQLIRVEFDRVPDL